MARTLPIAVLFTWTLVTACSPEEGSRASAAGPEAAPAAVRMPEITPDEGFPAKIKNFDGSTVLLEAPPARVLAGNASLLDSLILLIDPERMAALPSTAFDYSSLVEEPGAWAEVPLLKRFDAEEILAPEPDLVLVHAYQAGSAIDRVTEHDVPVVVLPIATSWKEILEQLEFLARLVGEEERGAQAVAGLEARRRELQRDSPRSGLRVLPYGNYGSGGSTAGAGTTWQVMIELSGMRNAAAEAGLDGHPEIDFEQLLSIAPDFFLIAEPEGELASSARGILAGESLLSDLEAVRGERYLVLPEYLYSAASHELLTAAERIAAQADAQVQ